MRNMKGLVAIAMAVATTGCVESVDQGYGYSNGYYGNGDLHTRTDANGTPAGVLSRSVRLSARPSVRW